jgi:carbonic anhydrase
MDKHQDTVIPTLFKGYKEFHKNYFIENPDIYSELKQGQHPELLIVACCDSRIDPAILFQLQPGQAFVVRNVGNIVGLYGSDPNGTFSALEYGIKVLEIKHIVVLGHSQCGAINALICPNHGFEYIDSWLLQRKSRLCHILEDKSVDQASLQRKCEQESILVSIRNLKTFPFINDDVTITGMYFDVPTGKLFELKIKK